MKVMMVEMDQQRLERVKLWIKILRIRKAACIARAHTSNARFMKNLFESMKFVLRLFKKNNTRKGMTAQTRTLHHTRNYLLMRTTFEKRAGGQSRQAKAVIIRFLLHSSQKHTIERKSVEAIEKLKLMQ